MATVPQITAQLGALDDDFALFRDNPPTRARVAALETKLGAPLRADHRALIEAMGACAVVASEKVWPAPRAFETRPAWQFWRGIEVFGLVAKHVAALDVVTQSHERAPAGGKRLVAAMRRLGVDWCVGYDARGVLYEWEPGGKPTKLGAKDLLTVLADWLRVLAKDKARMKKLGAAKAGAAGPATWVDKLDGDGARAAGKKLMKEPPAVRKAVVDLIAKALARGAEPTDYLWRLAWIASDARATDVLVAHARKGNSETRDVALGILGTHALPRERVVPVLLAALGESDEAVIGPAAEALASYADPTMIAPLTKALAKIQRNPRWVYGVAAGYIYTTLVAAAAKGSAADRDRVVDILTANLAPKASRYAALPAFEALVAMGPKAKRAIPALEKAVGGRDLYLSTHARHALGAITGDFTPHLAALRAAAKHKDGAVQASAEIALESASKRKRTRR